MDRPYDNRYKEETGDPWWHDSLLGTLSLSNPTGSRMHEKFNGKIPEESALLEGDVPIENLLFCLHRAIVELHRQGQEIQPWMEAYGQDFPMDVRAEHAIAMRRIVVDFSMVEQQITEAASRAEIILSTIQDAQSSWKKAKLIFEREI